jgi:hypothetical protein
VVHRLRVYVAPVEEVPGDKQEIQFVRDGVFLNYVVPGPEEVFRPLFQVVAAAAEVYVRKMEESHKTLFYESLITRPLRAAGNRPGGGSLD